MTQQASQIIKETKNKIIGLKRTLRVIQQDKIKQVYIASDIEEHIVRKINEACEEKQIPIIALNLTQKELGRLCQIEVGASIVAIMK
jgi:large subunit ribosomal protein L7A